MDPSLYLADWIGRRVAVVIDRALGSRHPVRDFTYQLNYGYVPDTLAPDGEPLDAYVLGADAPLEECEAEVIAIIRRRDDVEDKLVTALSGHWTAESILAATRFQERWFDAWVELPPQTQD